MQRNEIIEEILDLSAFAVGNGDVCEIIARRLRRLAEKIEESQLAPEEANATSIAPLPMAQLCWTGTTLYGVDSSGRVWFIEMKNGSWALHGNPIEPTTEEWEGLHRKRKQL